MLAIRRWPGHFFGRRATGAAGRAGPRALQQRLQLHLTLIGLALLWSIPTIALIVSSFRDPGAIASSGWWTALSAPFRFTLDNYDVVLSQRGMGRSFLNSIIITVPSTLLVILVAALAAYAFAWMDFPLRNFLLLAMVAMLVVPLQMTLIPVLRLYVHLNVATEVPLLGGNLFGTSSYPGIWVAHAAYGLPFAIYLLRSFFGRLQVHIHAGHDGAFAKQAMCHFASDA